MNEIARRILVEIIARHARPPELDVRQCEGLLRDYLRGEHKKESSVLVAALREQVVADLLASGGSMPAAVLLTRCTNKLQDQTGIAEDLARWSVESWACALGVIEAIPSLEERLRSLKETIEACKARMKKIDFRCWCLQQFPDLAELIEPRLLFWFLVFALCFLTLFGGAALIEVGWGKPVGMAVGILLILPTPLLYQWYRCSARKEEGQMNALVKREIAALESELRALTSEMAPGSGVIGPASGKPTSTGPALLEVFCPHCQQRISVSSQQVRPALMQCPLCSGLFALPPIPAVP
jgi:hypothetical protein